MVCEGSFDVTFGRQHVPRLDLLGFPTVLVSNSGTVDVLG